MRGFDLIGEKGGREKGKGVLLVYYECSTKGVR